MLAHVRASVWARAAVGVGHSGAGIGYIDQQRPQVRGERGRQLAGAAADDEGAQRLSRMRFGGEQRQRRQQTDIAGVGVVREHVRTGVLAQQVRAAAAGRRTVY